MGLGMSKKLHCTVETFFANMAILKVCSKYQSPYFDVQFVNFSSHQFFMFWGAKKKKYCSVRTEKLHKMKLRIKHL